jgi:hypothetical protein
LASVTPFVRRSDKIEDGIFEEMIYLLLLLLLILLPSPSSNNLLLLPHLLLPQILFRTNHMLIRHHLPHHLLIKLLLLNHQFIKQLLPNLLHINLLLCILHLTVLAMNIQVSVIFNFLSEDALRKY